MTHRASFILFMVVCAAVHPRMASSSFNDTKTQVLVFTKTTVFRHESIPVAVEAVKKLASENNFNFEATEDATIFTKARLSEFAAVIFLNTTGDVLNDEQQAVFEQYIRSGGGFVGVHAAADTEYDWPWYGELVGTRFANHPAVQPASIKIHKHDHPATKHLPEKWQRTDEWYNFRDHPRTRLGDTLMVLASLDETTYKGGTMGKEHPFAWCHEIDRGRAFYTAGGHTSESYSEAEFLQHLVGGIKWAARMNDAAIPSTQPSPPTATAPSNQ